MSRKGVFIPDITVEMLKNATLESVEEFMASGQMEDIEIPERPHGEWIPKTFSSLKCSKCEFEYNIMRCDFYLNMFFCPNCGADMRKAGEAE